MRWGLSSVLLVLLALLLTGMGDLGSAPGGTVPEAEENIRARVVDRTGIVTELTRFSLGGKVFIAGKRGRGEITVFFRDLRKIDFAEVQGENVPAELHLDSGKSLRLEVPKRNVFFGSTGYGTFRIQARDIRSIEFPDADVG